jgi:D-sedoheptulose 7-phosphate isomerase
MNSHLIRLKTRYPELEPCLPDVALAFDLLNDTFTAGGKLLVCGNGGSAADSDHIVGELMKGFERPRPVDAATRQALTALGAGDLADHLQGALPAISLSAHAALMTAYINDVAADAVYAQQVYGYGRPGDILLAISTSGNSRNVLNAVRVATARGLRSIGLTGADGGALRSLCDVTICVPYTRTLEVQERHLPVYHTLCLMLEEAFFV